MSGHSLGGVNACCGLVAAGPFSLRLSCLPGGYPRPIARCLPSLLSAVGADRLIIAEFEAVFQAHRGFYGSPRIHQELRASGCQVGRHCVARLMPRAELRAGTRKLFRPCSRTSRGAPGLVDNLRGLASQPPAANRCRAGDTTRIRPALVGGVSRSRTGAALAQPPRSVQPQGRRLEAGSAHGCRPGDRGPQPGPRPSAGGAREAAPP